MRSHPRGYALIINIWTTEGMTERAGSEVDVANLEQLFDQLGYKFTTFSDLSKKVTYYCPHSHALPSF